MSEQLSTRAQLAKALSNDELNYDEVIELAHALAAEDDKHVRFSADASIMDRLGKELVAKQETAVAELVKNAYDADATKVSLVFKNCSSAGGSLHIVDNGTGMTREQLVAGFMRLATQDKVDHPLSPLFGRGRAGRKGIGRFAAQRLGSRLVLRTRSSSSENGYEITINWGKYARLQNLFSISNEIIEIEDYPAPSGTTMIIENLRDAWSEAEIKRTNRYVSELLQPFSPSLIDEQAEKASQVDPGFKVKFSRVENGEEEVVADENTTFLQHAYATISAKVDDKGRGYWSVSSNKVELPLESKWQRVGPDKDRNDDPFPILRNVHLVAHYFLEDRDQPLPWNYRSIIRKALQDHGGIRLYRNGFRVLPYGEKNDDWLQLDYSYRLRHVLVQHGNQNFMGAIEVNDRDGELFEETSGREGLIENQAYRELTTFGYRAVINAVIQIGEARGRKATTRSKTKKQTPNDIVEAANSIAAELEEISKPNNIAIESKSDLSNDSSQKISEIREKVIEFGEKTSLGFQENIDEISMLRVLAGLGINIGEFTHEIRFLVGALSLGIHKINASGISNDEMNVVQNNLETLKTYAKYFDQTVTDNVDRKALVLEIRDIVDKFEESVGSYLSRKNIELQTDFKGYGLFTCPMHPSEWSSILLNLCTNSVKAIRRADSSGQILVSCSSNDTHLFVDFCDNGDGIAEENKNRIFDAFFTTTSPEGPDGSIDAELTGTGLGLKIVKDILTSYGGDIALQPAPDSYSTCLRVTVPRAKEEEIPEDAY